MYDAIVVGARAAGSPTALLLARKGYKVLLVDKAAFPSDTLSTHQIQLTGGARLKRWGLLDKLTAINTPPAHQVRFDTGAVVLQGSYLPYQGVAAVYSPRRIILDKVLLDAAHEAGAEVREDFIVEEILIEDKTVVGVRGRSKGGTSVIERARIVIGADGKHSLVAKAVQPQTYHEQAPLTMAYYAYWEGVPLEGGEMYARGRRAIGAWPTNDGLVMTYLAWPIEEFPTFRTNIEQHFLKTLDIAGTLGERVRAGRQVERFYGTADLPNFFRTPYGLGWALVGDAGLTKDPITGQGIADAFRDAELLSEALDAGFSGRRPLPEALADYQRQRDEDTLLRYQFTLQLASFAPPQLEQQLLFEALEDQPEGIAQLLGMMTGSVPLNEFFAPSHLFKLLGLKRMSQIMLYNLFKPRRTPRHLQAA